MATSVSAACPDICHRSANQPARARRASIGSLVEQAARSVVHVAKRRRARPRAGWVCQARARHTAPHMNARTTTAAAANCHATPTGCGPIGFADRRALAGADSWRFRVKGWCAPGVRATASGAPRTVIAVGGNDATRCIRRPSSHQRTLIAGSHSAPARVGTHVVVSVRVPMMYCPSPLSAGCGGSA